MAGTELAGDGFGVGTDADDVCELGGDVCDIGRDAVFGCFISSAASLTLVGTRVRRIALEVGVPNMSLGRLFGELRRFERSEKEVHGEGRGFRGEIIEADVVSEGTATAKEFRGPPTIGTLRVSAGKGLRNSDGRLCRGGLCREKRSQISDCLLLLIVSGLPGEHPNRRRPFSSSVWTRAGRTREFFCFAFVSRSDHCRRRSRTQTQS